MILQAFKDAARVAAKSVQRQSRDDLASTTDAKLGATFSFLRSAVGDDFPAMARFQRIYLYLLRVPASPGAKQHPELTAIMDHAVELAQCSVEQRTEELCALKGRLPDQVYQQRRSGTFYTLRKLSPGAAHKVA